MIRYLYILCFCLITILLKSQEQWFPAKYNEELKEFQIDTNRAFPVSYIRLRKSAYQIFACRSPYYKIMKFTKEGWFSKGVSLALSNKNEEYAYAKYYFKKQKDKTKALLIIKRENKTDTIMFLKSKIRVSETMFEWG